jgi:hypothetical protein
MLKVSEKNRTVTLAEIPLEGETQFIQVELYYHEGGWNYFIGVKEGRGYVLGARPVTISDERGYRVVSFMAFSGTKHTIKEANRYSKNTLLKLAKEYSDPSKYQYLVDHVLSKDPNLSLKKNK